MQDLLKQGYQARNIVFLGDSAGGGLVPAMAIQLRREGVTLPAALGMFSPHADLRNLGDTQRTMIGVDLFFLALLIFQAAMEWTDLLLSTWATMRAN